MARNIGGRRQPSARPSLERRYRRQSTPQSVRDARLLGGPSRSPLTGRARRARVTGPRNATATDAGPPSQRAPSAPPFERLWRSLKYEEVFISAYGSVAEARRRLGAWLVFYNNERPTRAISSENQLPSEVRHRQEGRTGMGLQGAGRYLAVGGLNRWTAVTHRI